MSGYGLVDAFPGVKFDRPVVVASPPGETNRLFVVEKAGRIMVIPDLRNPKPQVYLDVSSQTHSIHWEMGMLGLAFHPGFATNGYLYVFRSVFWPSPGNPYMTHQVLSRFTADPAANYVLWNTEHPIMFFADTSYEHNGGDLEFGPDGYLYVSLGELGAPAHERPANPSSITKGFFGGIARIDVDGRAGNLAPNPHPSGVTNYWIPADNPFIGATSHNGIEVDPSKSRTEFYAVGLRNPWRMSFDSQTGKLVCADVGAVAWEEINVIEKGGDYGWPHMEGPAGSPAPGSSPQSPFYAYPHGYNAGEGIAIIGGLVYRARSNDPLNGMYIYGDHGSGSIWSLDIAKPGSQPRFLAGETGSSSFGIDPANGDVLVANHNLGVIRRLVYVPPEQNPNFPKTLADTRIFSDLTSLTTVPAFAPYNINVPFWSDGAIKRRWFALPEGGAQIEFSPAGNWTFPTGAVWVKHFDLELEKGKPESARRLETRVLVKTEEGAYGLTYRWGDSRTNAALVPADGMTETFEVRDGGGSRSQQWVYPSRMLCQGCHVSQAGHALGFNTPQLNCPGPVDSQNQLARFQELGLFKPRAPIQPALMPALASPSSTSAPLGHKARSYLAANCIQCHQPGGVAARSWDARIELPLTQAKLVEAPASWFLSPTSLPNHLLTPNEPGRSTMLNWLSSRGVYQMPPYGSMLSDDGGIALLTEWIKSFPRDPWHETQVGFGLQGYTSIEEGKINLSATRLQMSASTNAWHMALLPQSGNGQIVARLSEFQGSSDYSSAGLAVMTSESEESPFMVIQQSRDGRVSVSKRAANWAEIQEQTLGNTAFGAWFRLTRSEEGVSASFSSDGQRWSGSAELPVALSANLEMGFAVKPVETGRFSMAAFQDFRILSPSILTPENGENLLAGDPIPISLAIHATNTSAVKAEFFANGKKIGEDSAPPFEFLWNEPPLGQQKIQAQVTDQWGGSVATETVSTFVTLDRVIGRFQGINSTAGGNWQGVFGSEGFLIPGATGWMRDALSVTFAGAEINVLDPASSSRKALERPGAGAGRIASIWKSDNILRATFRLGDGKLHQAALYFADWWGSQILELELLDADTGTFLDRRQVRSFGNGAHILAGLKGNVTVQIRNLSGGSPILGGIFLDSLLNSPPAVTVRASRSSGRLPVSVEFSAEASDADGIYKVEFRKGESVLGTVFAPPYTFAWTNATAGAHDIYARAFDLLGERKDSTPVRVELTRVESGAVFVGMDDAPGGNWRGEHSVYAIAGVGTNLAPGINVSFDAGDIYVWQQNAFSPWAVETEDGLTRTAAAWLGNLVRFRVSFDDAAWHEMALYLLDWTNSGWISDILVKDAQGAVLFDQRNATQFGYGKRYKWEVKGEVVVELAAQFGYASLAALFLDPGEMIHHDLEVRLSDLPGSANPTLEVVSTPGARVALQFSTNLVNWIELQRNTIPPSGILQAPFNIQSQLSGGFYRAIILPN